MSPYLLWKTAHVVSASILFGTGLGIAFFAWFGYRRAIRANQIGALRSVLSLTVIADACFTAPAVVFQAVSGFVLVHLNSWPLNSPWATTVQALFVLVGLLWLLVVAIQIQLSREANRTDSIGNLSQQFHRRFRWWFGLGVPAFVGVIILYFLMVTKLLPVIIT